LGVAFQACKFLSREWLVYHFIISPKIRFAYLPRPALSFQASYFFLLGHTGGFLLSPWWPILHKNNVAPFRRSRVVFDTCCFSLQGGHF
jgi:hypothetical protein